MRALALIKGPRPPRRIGSKLSASIAEHFCGYVGSSWRSWPPSWRQHVATYPKNALQNAILEPTWLKTIPKTPQQATPTPQNSEKPQKNLKVFNDFCYPTHVRKYSQIDAKSIQNRSQKREVEHQVAILAATWPNLDRPCSNLVLT